ncbi:MAG: HAD family hydrolase [Nitrospinaceae bacterium]|jgi:phosphoglycolate phosphatase|nr:HAD family hydrolase [Nitrospinaceae bacterium]
MVRPIRLTTRAYHATPARSLAAGKETMKIRAILFDHDGTLVDSYEGIARCMHLTCRDLGKPELNDAEVRASIGPTLENRFAELWGSEISEHAAKVYRSHYEIHFISGTKLIEGVRETLDAIADMGFLIACVTNKTQTYCVRQLEHFDLMKRMECVVGARQGYAPKPDPAMILAVLEKLDLTPEEAVMVGDTPIDVAASHAAGVQAWAVGGNYASKDELNLAEPNHFFEDITKVIDFISNKSKD